MVKHSSDECALVSTKFVPETVTHVDVLIIGAGAAGLCLFLELQQNGYPLSVQVLERNSGPLNDRLWSFWDSPIGRRSNSGKFDQLPNYLRPIIAKQWQKWRLTSIKQSYLMQHTDYQYSSVQSQALGKLALECASENALFDIHFNCGVSTVAFKNNEVIVNTAQQQFVANKVIDTRPPPIDPNHTGLLQCFYGEEVVVNAQIFDTTTVDLMQEIKCSSLGIEFVYILPFSATHALIEFTCFSLCAVKKSVLKARLHEIIKDLVKQHTYQVARSEGAILPMYLIDQNIDNEQENFIYAGTAGGAMRASTGYSFLNSVRWAKRCAHDLKNKNRLTKIAPVNKIYRALDAVMLRVLRDDMSLGVRIFERMFERVSPSSFARFMIQKASLIDILKVIWAMPKWPFMRAALLLLTDVTKRAIASQLGIKHLGQQKSKKLQQAQNNTSIKPLSRDENLKNDGKFK